jgi:hypothetical protein
MSTDDDFVCQRAMPGWSCHMPEMSALGVLFFLEALLCIFCFVSKYRHHRSTNPNQLGSCSMASDVVFWVSMLVWCVYEGVLRSVYFPAIRSR